MALCEVSLSALQFPLPIIITFVLHTHLLSETSTLGSSDTAELGDSISHRIPTANKKPPFLS
jgi:hypothetical protein